MNAFSLFAALPLIYREDVQVALSNTTLQIQSQSSDEIYITEQELKRIWSEKSQLPFGKAITKFDLKEALLLVEDEEDVQFFQADDGNVLETSIVPVRSSQVSLATDVDLDDAEIYVVEEVLTSKCTL